MTVPILIFVWMPHLVKHLLQEWDAHGLPSDARVILACSGGKDSMVLLDVLLQAGKTPLVAHANFGLRGEESDGDEAFVRETCERYNLTFFSSRFHTQSFAREQGISIQMAARELRYAWLRELALKEQALAILTAHHGMDQAETVLLNLMRGSGVKGVKGMEVLSRGLFRPLLTCDQDEILRHAGNFRVRWREDSSNPGIGYKRNFIRHQVLKPWEEAYPGTVRQIMRSTELLGEQYKYLIHKLETELKEYVDPKNGHRISVRICDQPYSILLLRSWLDQYGMADQTIFVIEASRRTGAQFSSKTHELLIDREWMIVREKKPSPELEKWLEPMQSCDFGDWHFHWVCFDGWPTQISDSYALRIDPEIVHWPLQLRQMRPGDRIRPFGMKGSKLISDLFTDAKLDRFTKEGWPLLCMDDQVIWVPGLRGSELLRTGRTEGRFLVLLAEREAERGTIPDVSN